MIPAVPRGSEHSKGQHNVSLLSRRRRRASSSTVSAGDSRMCAYRPPAGPLPAAADDIDDWGADLSTSTVSGASVPYLRRISSR
ncbi:hypothetical protein CSPX01_07207 [Colletotrichum filicis]|nr:hypothetical protein CSPX01_07207 [Colletotrichum filicis]